MNRHDPSRRAESGNVLYYILIAIVLLGALTLAVANGGRGSFTTLTADKQRLLATEMIDYAHVMAEGATQLKLRGIAPASLSFASDQLDAGYGAPGTTPEAELFNPAGGAINYQSPPAEAMVTSGQDWVFTGSNAVQDVGSTCSDSSCSDLVMIAGPLRPEICLKINELLGVPNDAGEPPAEGAISATIFAGTFTHAGTIGDDGGIETLRARSAACIRIAGTTDDYFYQVLIGR